MASEKERRSGTDRRVQDERRGDKDRRQKQVPIDFPDRRKGERRRGDRRSGEDRRG